MKISPSTIGILGAGNIGRNAAIHFIRAGHPVYLANSRGPASLHEVTQALGSLAHAATVHDAVAAADIVLLALPWAAKEDTIQAAGGAGAFAGKIVIDAMNPYLEYPAVEDLAGRSSTEVVAGLLDPSARVVKAFNTIYYVSLADDARPGAPLDERIAIPVAGNDGPANDKIAALIESIGFAPVIIGGLPASLRQEPNQPLYNRNFTLPEFQAELARPSRS
jgi:predicted dinucleotide-binding enzyme